MKVCGLLGPDPEKDWHHLERFGFKRENVLAVDCVPARATKARSCGFIGFTGTMSEALFCQTKWFNDGFDFIYYDGCRQTADIFGLFASPIKEGAMVYLNLYRRYDGSKWRELGSKLAKASRTLAEVVADECGVSIKNRGVWAFIHYAEASFYRTHQLHPSVKPNDFIDRFMSEHPLSMPGVVGRVLVSEYRTKGTNYMDQLRIVNSVGHSTEALRSYGPDDIRNDTGHEFFDNLEGRIAASLAVAKRQGLRK